MSARYHLEVSTGHFHSPWPLQLFLASLEKLEKLPTVRSFTWGFGHQREYALTGKPVYKEKRHEAWKILMFTGPSLHPAKPFAFLKFSQKKDNPTNFFRKFWKFTASLVFTDFL